MAFPHPLDSSLPAVSACPDWAAFLGGSVPAGPAGNFGEALQRVQRLHSELLRSGKYHISLGRFDRYLWAYAKSGVESGTATWADITEQVARFFVSLTPAPGTIVLGGPDCNALTEACLAAAAEVRLREPLPVLRLAPRIPDELMRKAAALTDAGGRLCCANDQAILSALRDAGWSPEAVAEYCISPSGQYLVPGREICAERFGTVSFRETITAALRHVAEENGGFSAFVGRIRADLAARVEEAVKAFPRGIPPLSPLLRAAFPGGEVVRVSVRGVDVMAAARLLAVVRRRVFVENTVPAEYFLQKTDPLPDGDDDPNVDFCLAELTRYFTEICVGKGVKPDVDAPVRVEHATGDVFQFKKRIRSFLSCGAALLYLT